MNETRSVSAAAAGPTAWAPFSAAAPMPCATATRPGARGWLAAAAGPALSSSSDPAARAAPAGT